MPVRTMCFFPAAGKLPPALAVMVSKLVPDWIVETVDDPLRRLRAPDKPDLMLIHVDHPRSRFAYAVADRYRAHRCHVVLGGFHGTLQLDEASLHADTILVGPCEQVLPCLLRDWQAGHASKRYIAGWQIPARAA